MMRYRNYIFLFFIFSFEPIFAQNKPIDSILVLIESDKSDLIKAAHFNELAWQYLMLGDADSTVVFSNKALVILNGSPESEKSANMVRTYSNLGMANADKGNFSSSLSYFFKALKISEEMGNKQLVADNLSNVGNVYGNLGEFDKSLEYFLKAMKISESFDNKSKMASTLGNIGILYDSKNDPAKALEYYFKALEIHKALNNKDGISSNLGNIGLSYNNLGEKEKAITYYLQALIITKEIGDKRGMAIWQGNIGELYSGMMADASVSEKKNLGKQAESYLLNALEIDTTLGFLHHLENTYHNLSELYSQMQEYKKSLNYYQLYTSAKDSIFNDEKNKEITRKEMSYEFEKKEAALKAEQEKKEAVAEADKKRQLIFFWLISLIAIAIAVIAVIVFRSLRITRQQKQIIEIQKQLVEEKQSEVLDSIHYAKRIQQSLLPTGKYIDKNINRLKGKNL